jgi:hypothetical protein
MILYYFQSLFEILNAFMTAILENTFPYHQHYDKISLNAHSFKQFRPSLLFVIKAAPYCMLSLAHYQNGAP